MQSSTHDEFVVAGADRMHLPPAGARAAVEQSLLDELRQRLPALSLEAAGNLSYCGLSSVDFLQLLAYIQAQFGCELTLNEIWTAQSIEAIAELICRALDAPTSSARDDRAAPTEAPANRRAASPQQRRFWRVHRPTETRFSEVVTATVPLPHGIGLDRAREAIDRIVDRHDSLRTVFAPEQDRLLAVGRAVSIELEELDLRPAPWPAALQGVLRAEAGCIYDAMNGPLMRCQLVRGPDARDVLIVNLYHLICDGTSKQILGRDLAATLQALARGETPDLRPPDWSYAQYCDWSNWLQDQPAFDSARAYWRQIFSAGFEPLHLSDRKQDRLDAAAYSYTFRLGHRLSSAAGDHARRCGTTVFAVLLTAFMAHLSSWTGNQQIVVGVPTNGRNHPSVQDTVGLFSNSLLIRHFAAAPPARFAERLSQTHAQLMGAQQHQIYQYDEIARDLQLAFEIERFPITGVYFNNIPHGLADGFSEFVDERFCACGGSVKYDLLANYRKAGEHIEFCLEHRRSAFSEAGIRAFAAGLKSRLVSDLC